MKQNMFMKGVSNNLLIFESGLQLSREYWLKDFIDLDGLSIEDIARKLTLAGLEVDEILYVGLPMPVRPSMPTTVPFGTFSDIPNSACRFP